MKHNYVNIVRKKRNGVMCEVSLLFSIESATERGQPMGRKSDFS